MIQTTVTFKIDRNDKEFRFTCNSDASLGETFDALTEFRQHVINTMASLEAQEKKNGEGKMDTESPRADIEGQAT